MNILRDEPESKICISHALKYCTYMMSQVNFFQAFLEDLIYLR